jgi:prefoldin subunit 5
MSTITAETKLSDLIAQYPWLKGEMAKVNEKFKLLNSPVGKIMLGKATIAEMSKKSGMEIDKLVRRLKTLIEEHKD